MTAKIVITEFMDEAAVTDLSGDYDVIYDPGLVDQTERLLGELRDADAIIVRNRTQVRGDLLQAAPNLKAVGRLGVGLDNIDLEACQGLGISVHPASGANDLSVAEYVVTTAAVLLRTAYFGQARMIAGEWPRQEMQGRECAGKVLGLVGFGSIARETATKAEALGMTVAAMDPFVHKDDPAWTRARRQETLYDLLAVSDILSLHVPLTDDTRNLIDAKALATMKQGSIIINAARGGVLDEAALAASIRSGHLGGAALDVFAAEPLSAEEGAKFAGLPNLILTPHIAGVTKEANVRVSALTAQNIRNVLER